MVTYYCYHYVDPRCHEIIYVGKGKVDRITVHLRKGATNKWFAHKLEKIKQAGLEPEIFSISCPSDLAAQAIERFWISVIGRLDLNTGSLCNMTSGGDGGSGRTWTDAVKLRVSQANTGLKRTPETCALISKVKLEKMNDATRVKMSLSKLGTSHTDVTKQKLSTYFTGKPRIIKDLVTAKQNYSLAAKARTPEHYLKTAAGRKQFYINKRQNEETLLLTYFYTLLLINAEHRQYDV